MSRAVLLLGLLSGARMIFAQCGMTTGIFVNASCSSADFGVSTEGGTSPYFIIVEVHAYQGPWTTAANIFGDQDGAWSDGTPGLWLDRCDQARVTVTDANGCVATHTTPPWQPTYYQDGTLMTSVDCTTGASSIEFRPVDMGPLAPSSWSYSLDSGPLTPFLQSWTQVPGSDPVRYRFNTSVSAGTHTFLIPNTTSPTYIFCGLYLTITVVGPLTPGDCGVNFRMRGALDGALPTGTLMSDGLRTANLIPLTQPYTALGYTFVGSPTNVTITPAQLANTGNDAIVDWMVVELRSNINTVVWSKPVLLQRDGDLVDTDGNNYLNFPVVAGNYYVALRHRNHLGVMTSGTRALTVDPSVSLVDFRSSSTGTYGSNARVQKGSVWCLWAGDATGNGTVKYTGSANDRDPILLSVGSTTPNNTLPNVYDRRDTNLDGVIKYTGSANDRDIILTNVGSTTPTNTRIEQLP